MGSADFPPHAAHTVAAALQHLEPQLAALERERLRELLSGLAERLAECGPAGEAREAIESALGVCRRLYSLGRSPEAILLARAALAATPAGDAQLARRAATACGLLAGDAADLVAAVEYHVVALRHAGAEGNPLAAARVWNNIGLALGICAHYELAAGCYRRSLAACAGAPPGAYERYVALANLAGCLYHLGACDEGLARARQALDEQTEAFREHDAHAALLLRRDLVRLLVAGGRVEEAAPHVAECVALAERIRTPRASLALLLTRALHDRALGRVDLALTRLEQATAQARQMPSALRETLVIVIQAEEAAGHYDRALARLRELSEHVYRFAVDRARQHVELESLPAPGVTRLEHEREQAAARISARLAPPAPPPEWAVLDRLAVSAALRVDPSGGHGKRVGVLVKALATARGLPPLEALEMGLAAELHDIGLLSVPEGILRKREPLNAAERAIVERHVEAGVEMLADDRHARVFAAREIAAYHHARWDGEGYPDRVAGNRIPLAARMCAIADAYDAMVCGIGGGQKAMDAALAELQRQAGRHFDPELVLGFDRMLREQTHDLGLELAASPGLTGFHQLVRALREDRGFV